MSTLAGKRFDRLDIDVTDGVAVVRMDGGPLGLLDRPLVTELSALVGLADRDPAVRAVVLTGARPDRFAGHADVRWMRDGADASPAVNRTGATAVMRFVRAAARSATFRKLAGHTPLAGAIELDRFHDTFVRMNASSVVYVAALSGSALGGGAELAWTCDIRVMADDENVVIGQPEVLMGFNPGGGGTQRLAHLIGTQHALLAMLEGRPFSPAEALRLGAVDTLARREDVVDEAVSWARRFGARPAAAIGAIKRAVYFGASSPLREGLLAERAEFLHTLGAPETRAVMNAYASDYEAAGRLLLHEPANYQRALNNGQWPQHQSTTSPPA